MVSSAVFVVGTQLLSVTFDQGIEPGSITAANFIARTAAFERKINQAYTHIGGPTIGPMPITTDGGFGPNPELDFLDIPAGEIVNATTGAAAQSLNNPLTVI